MYKGAIIFSPILGDPMADEVAFFEIEIGIGIDSDFDWVAGYGAHATVALPARAAGRRCCVGTAANRGWEKCPSFSSFLLAFFPFSCFLASLSFLI